MRRLTRRQRLAAIALAALALCFITLDLGGGSLSGAHSGVRGSLGALYRGTDSVLGPIRRFVQGVPHAGTNETKIHNLEHENAALRQQLAQHQADAATASQLTSLQLAARRLGQRVVPARVIAFGPGQGFDWTVTIDAGSSSGVKIGMTVTDGADVVGRVVAADDSTSRILLAVDPGSGIGARDSRSGELGVATGAGTSGFTFVPLDPNSSIKVGDTIMTGPSASSSFVAGLEIGTVKTVRTSTDGTIRASVAAAIPPGTLDLVGVILAGGTDSSSRPALGTDSSLAGGR